jgi:ubiquinone biosynthesis O-methyltransferase
MQSIERAMLPGAQRAHQRSFTKPFRRRVIALSYGLICSGLFGAAIAAMFVMMFFGLSRSFGQLHAPSSWLANGFLLVQFPLLHSFLLTRRGRVFLRRLAPAEFAADLATTSYVIIASAQVLLLFALWSPSGVIWWRSEGSARAVLCCLYTGAWLLLLRSIFDAGIALHTGSLGWRAVLSDERPIYPGLPKSGLFRLTRQPIYASFSLILWTVPTWTPDQLMLATTLTAYCVVGPLFKEARFRRVYGEAFESMVRRVPYWLPWPRPSSTMARVRNDLSIYQTCAEDWWTGRYRWLRMLQDLVGPRLHYLAGVVEDWHGKDVLDLGCGGGFMAEALAVRGAKVVGIDPSEPAIAIAKKHAQEGNLDIDYRIGRAEDIPAQNCSVDCVICFDVLEHVDDLDPVLEEIRRVLKPGGLFAFDTINRTMLAKWVFVILGEEILRIIPRGVHDPFKFITPYEVRTKLLQRGFTVGAFVGLGPRGLDRQLDFTFGQLPTVAISYLGCAAAAQ